MVASDLRQRRRRSSSAVSALADAATVAEQKLSSAMLLLWDELPYWRRDNAFILSGYRPASNSYAASFLSTFSVHNESVNIWTQSVPPEYNFRDRPLRLFRVSLSTPPRKAWVEFLALSSKF